MLELLVGVGALPVRGEAAASALEPGGRSGRGCGVGVPPRWRAIPERIARVPSLVAVVVLAGGGENQEDMTGARQILN